MYLVTDAHPAIIDRDTFNLTQQELARRTSKRRISTKAVTEQGKYSSKYALTELLICGECGTPYRRCSWNIRGKKRKVWRCLNRLENGTKYCHDSPTLDEAVLQRTIVHTVNDFYDCGDEVAQVLSSNTEAVFKGESRAEYAAIENRLAEIDQARSEFIGLIASGAVGEDSLDDEFQKLYEEEQELVEKREALKIQNQTDSQAQMQIDAILTEIEQTDFRLTEYDDVLVRKLIECIKVVDKDKVQIIFKGGIKITADLME